ncbi:MAG: HD domain-containing protein [Kofleriaceae bacterium]
MASSGLLRLPDGAATRSRTADYFAADPVAILDLAGEISERGEWPAPAVGESAYEVAPRLAEAPLARLRDSMQVALMGHDVDVALEWLREVGAIGVLFPELAATVDLVQEPGRQHKDVWAHTKQVVRQTVRRPLVRWAALLHDIGKVPTRTYTEGGVHFHGHAEVGARMFDRIHPRFAFARDERQTVKFLVRNHLRTNQYSDAWTDSAVRRFHRDLGPHLRDLLDLSRADITSKRPGRRKQLLEQISALAERAERLAEADAKLPPLPGGVGNAIMEAFAIAPSRLIGDLKRLLEQAITDGALEARREDGYYVSYLARHQLVPGADPERCAALAAAGHDVPEPAPDDDDGHDGDPERPRPGCSPAATIPTTIRARPARTTPIPDRAGTRRRCRCGSDGRAAAITRRVCARAARVADDTAPRAELRRPLPDLGWPFLFRGRRTRGRWSRDPVSWTPVDAGIDLATAERHADARDSQDPGGG